MIGLIAHSEKEEARTAVCAMIAELTKKSIEFDLEAETAALAGLESNLDETSLARKSELLVVMGGDGTILRVVHELGATIRPVLGVNIGSLGFLTCAGLSEIPRAVESIVRKDFILSPRNLLIAEITCSTGKRERFHGLNDVVISRGERSQLVRIQVQIDGAELTTTTPTAHYCHADRLDGIFAGGWRSDPHAGFRGIRDHSDLPSRSHQSLHGR
jgi:NAD+ kinase